VSAAFGIGRKSVFGYVLSRLSMRNNASALQMLFDDGSEGGFAVSMPVEFSPKAPLENSPLRFGSVTAITTGRDDRGEVVEVEIDDGLKRLGGGAVAQAFGQGFGPGDIFSLQGEQSGDGVTPTLGAAAPVGGLSIANHGRRLLGELAGTIASLALGIAQGVFALRLATSWHRAFSVT
jgi:hypothetical protein